MGGISGPGPDGVRILVDETATLPGWRKHLVVPTNYECTRTYTEMAHRGKPPTWWRTTTTKGGRVRRRGDWIDTGISPVERQVPKSVDHPGALEHNWKVLNFLPYCTRTLGT